MTHDWQCDIYKNVKSDIELPSVPKGISSLLPPIIELPILYNPKALSDNECDNLRDLILRKEEEIIKKFSPVPIAGQKEGLTPRWMDYNILSWKEKEADPVRRAICEGYQEYLKSTGYPRWTNFAQCWANKLQEKNALAPHRHNFRQIAAINGTISLVKCNTKTIFVFPIHLMSEKTSLPIDTTSYETGKGHMIIIPSWLTHFTTPVPAGETRFTLGFDIAGHFNRGQNIPFDKPDELSEIPTGQSLLKS